MKLRQLQERDYGEIIPVINERWGSHLYELRQ